MGMIWWDLYNSHSLNHSRPHLVEIISSNFVVVSNLTFLNAPAYSIHPVYCRYIFFLLLDTYFATKTISNIDNVSFNFMQQCTYSKHFNLYSSRFPLYCWYSTRFVTCYGLNFSSSL